MKLTGDNMIRFNDVEYTYKITITLDTQIISGSGTIITDTLITSRGLEFSVDNNVLDSFSMEIDDEINADLIRTLLSEYNIRQNRI